MISAGLSRFKNFLEGRGFFLFAGFFALSFFGLSYFSLWTETEIYPAHSSQYLWTKNSSEFLFALKPLFYFVLHLSSVISDLISQPPMVSARGLFAINGIAILSLMFFYIKKKTNSYNAILAVLFLVSTNIFLDRGFRVRSDLLVSSFSLLSLYLAMHAKKESKIYKAVFILLSTLLISPKAIYWLLFGFCFMLNDLKGRVFERYFFAKVGVGFFLLFSVVSFIFEDPFFIESVKQSGWFYFSSLQKTWGMIIEQGWIPQLYQLSHLVLFVERNLLAVLLIIAKLVFTVHSVQIVKQRNLDMSDLGFAILLAIILIHPQQKLFFLCSLMPFLCIAFFTDWTWRKWFLKKFSPQFKFLLLVGAYLYSFSYIAHFSKKIYYEKNNLRQKELVGKLNHFYKNTDPAVDIFDPNCLVYKRKTNCKYIFDDPVAIKKSESQIQARIFDLILPNGALNLFKIIHQSPKSAFQYVNIKNYIYYKGFILHLTDSKSIKKYIGKNRSRQKTLSGKKLVMALPLYLKTKADKNTKKYSYLFLESLKPKRRTSSCPHFKKELYPGCLYSKSEFESGLIPYSGEKILALFYLPLPPDLPKELSLQSAFQYDKF